MNSSHLQLRKGYDDLVDLGGYDADTLTELLKTFETLFKTERQKADDPDAENLLSMDVRLLRAELFRRNGTANGNGRTDGAKKKP